MAARGVVRPGAVPRGAQYSRDAGVMKCDAVACGWCGSGRDARVSDIAAGTIVGWSWPQRALNSALSVSGLLVSRSRCGYFRPSW